MPLQHLSLLILTSTLGGKAEAHTHRDKQRTVFMRMSGFASFKIAERGTRKKWEIAQSLKIQAGPSSTKGQNNE